MYLCARVVMTEADDMGIPYLTVNKGSSRYMYLCLYLIKRHNAS